MPDLDPLPDPVTRQALQERFGPDLAAIEAIVALVKGKTSPDSIAEALKLIYPGMGVNQNLVTHIIPPGP